MGKGGLIIPGGGKPANHTLHLHAIVYTQGSGSLYSSEAIKLQDLKVLPYELCICSTYSTHLEVHVARALTTC